MNVKKLTNVYLLLMLSFMWSCKEAPPTQTDACTLPEENSQNEDVPNVPCELPSPSQGQELTVNAFLREFSPEQEDKMRRALERLKIVVNSKEFKEAVLSHTYQGETTFVDNKGMSNVEVYQAIMAGVETLNDELDHEMDLDITLYYSNNSTVGYTYPNTTRVWVNNKFFAGYSLSKVAANAMHEWLHKIGFGHDYNRTARRAYSVPYAVGTIVRNLIDEM